MLLSAQSLLLLPTLTPALRHQSPPPPLVPSSPALRVAAHRRASAQTSSFTHSFNHLFIYFSQETFEMKFLCGCGCTGNFNTKKQIRNKMNSGSTLQTLFCKESTGLYLHHFCSHLAPVWPFLCEAACLCCVRALVLLEALRGWCWWWWFSSGSH